MQGVRIRYKKEGRARYISHIDLNRCMSRAVRRAQLPLWYTEGFTPHPYLDIALPLSLFYESDSEVMDARLEDGASFGEVRQRLAAQMPEGITVYDAYPPRMKASAIGFAGYWVKLLYDGVPAEGLESTLAGLRGMDSVVIEKEGKRHLREIEVKGLLQSAQVTCFDGGMELLAVLPASSRETVNPSCFAEAFRRYAGLEPVISHIRRTAIYTGEMEPFV